MPAKEAPQKIVEQDTCAWNFQLPINQNFCYKYTVVTKEHHSELIKALLTSIGGCSMPKQL